MSGTAVKPRAAHASARADAAAVVERAGLPAELGELVLSVTGSVRLWRAERAEVARELCAHLSDGLEAGRTPAQLRTSFGDPARAAALILRAKRRQRPWWWHAQRRAWMGLLLVLAIAAVVYGVLALRFFLASPTIKHNYIAELNAAVRATAPEDRAWPLYVQSIREFGKRPDFMMSAEYSDPQAPGEPHWDVLSAWLKDHHRALETVRRAAGKPLLGYVYRASLDPDLGRAMESLGEGFTYQPEDSVEPDNPLVIGVLLPHLAYMRKYTRWLSADAALAVSERDSARFEADINAMLGMAEQALGERFIISQLVGLAIGAATLETVLRTLDNPDAVGLLSGARLTTLAHRLAGFAGGRVRIDTSQERVFIDDVLQRFYTDDGRGDGYLVNSTETKRLYDDFGVVRPKGHALLTAIGPVQSVLLPSRKAVNARTDAFIAAAATDDLLPPWRHNERTSDERWRELMRSGIYTVLPIIESLLGGDDQGPTNSAFAARDLFEARRDGALVVLALEVARRRTGAYPATLAELTPAFLPRVPLDPFDGKPLRYLAPKSAADRPVLYSVGVDGVDDGGTAPATKAGRADAANLGLLAAFRGTVAPSDPQMRRLEGARGDWVLWPRPPEVGQTAE